MKKISYLNSVLDDRPSFFEMAFFQNDDIGCFVYFPNYNTLWVKTSNPFKASWAKSLKVRENSRIIIILETSPTAWYGLGAVRSPFSKSSNKAI